MPRKKLDPTQGGCWFCSEDETDAFDTEFDTNLHLACLRETLEREPDHPEAVHMRYLLEPFEPDWASPPGATIADLIVAKVGVSESPVNEMVTIPERLGLCEESFRELLLGEIPITEQLAEKLSEVLGGSARFWRNRETQYRELMERRVDATAAAERISAAARTFVPSVFDTAATMIARSDLVLMATEFVRLKNELAELKQQHKKTAAARMLHDALGGAKPSLDEPTKETAAASNPRPGSLYYRELGVCDEIVVYPMLFGRARLCLSRRGDDGILDAFCYESPERAIEAAKVWTGEGDPLDGWNRHPNSGRYRPGGDPAKEQRG